MENDAATTLRAWAQRLEDAWGCAIGFTDEGALVLETGDGVQVAVEPVPLRPGLVLTAGLAEIGDDTPARLYQALLALNLDPLLSASGHVGLAPQSRSIVLRLIWTPDEPQWHEDAFFQLLAAFGSHADRLARAIASREIEKILAPRVESAAPGVHLTPTNLA